MKKKRKNQCNKVKITRRKVVMEGKVRNKVKRKKKRRLFRS